MQCQPLPSTYMHIHMRERESRQKNIAFLYLQIDLRRKKQVSKFRRYMSRATWMLSTLEGRTLLRLTMVGHPTEMLYSQQRLKIQPSCSHFDHQSLRDVFPEQGEPLLPPGLKPPTICLCFPHNSKHSCNVTVAFLILLRTVSSTGAQVCASLC